MFGLCDLGRAQAARDRGREDRADLRAPLRASPDDEPERQAIREAIARKPKGHDFDYSRQHVAGQMTRFMSHTGG